MFEQPDRAWRTQITSFVHVWRLQLVPLVLVLAILGAGIATVASAAGSGVRPELRFDSLVGSELPNNGAMAEVVVACVGRPGTSCKGVVRLLPRGPQTVHLVGGAPIASHTISAGPAGNEHGILLGLNQRAREALANGKVLQVTIELRQPGHAALTKNVVAALERSVVGHSRPDSIKRGVVTAASGRSASTAASIETRTYEWKWDIPVRHFLVLPDFRCSGSTPFVAGSDMTRTYIPQRTFHAVEWGRRGKLKAVAKSGTGYGSFEAAHTDTRNGIVVMTGWPKGSWTTNNVWAPVLFEDGHFELTVTCTSSDQRGDVAWVDETKSHVVFPRTGLFPWIAVSPKELGKGSGW